MGQNLTFFCDLCGRIEGTGLTSTFFVRTVESGNKSNPFIKFEHIYNPGRDDIGKKMICRGCAIKIRDAVQDMEREID